MGAHGFFTTRELRARGETTKSLRAAVEAGFLIRVIKGWYATARSSKEAILAMRMGGRLGCVSALAVLGAWVPPDCGVHVLFPTGASGRRSAGREKGASIVRHWCAPADRSGSAWAIAPIEIAIADALQCQPPHMLVAVLDSLLFRGLISRNRLEAIIRRGPQRAHHLIEHLEPRSESGIESILRYLLAVAGITTAVQVRMRSNDRTDLEVDDWLVIEADGREVHAQAAAFTKDRVRVVRLMRQGRIVLQFAYATIMYDVDFVLDAIRDVIARHAPVR